MTPEGASAAPAGPHPAIPLERVTRAVVWNQALWTAGYSLTTGGFLLYFAQELGATGFLTALLLVIPETVGLTGLLTRPTIRLFGHRKGVWIGFSLAARAVSVGIPLMAFPQLRPEGLDPLWIMAACLAVYHGLQWIAYLAYISWLADLVDEHHWGRFFARRNVAKLAVLLVVPVAGGYLRDWWNSRVPDETALLAYVAAFTLGIALLLFSLVPLLRLPEVPVRAPAARRPDWRLIAAAFRDRSFRFLLVHNWWLAFANGLTQAAFFRYLFGPLGIPLGTYYVLTAVMRLVKIPVSLASGTLCDRFGNKTPLFWGVLAASSALLCWLAATPDRWGWLFAAYLLWGCFATVNIAGRNLVLKLAPRSDNATHLALFRQIGGLLAGASGLLGGLWLDNLTQTGFAYDLAGYHLGGFQLLFLLSFLGRVTSAVWILPIREPGSRGLLRMLRVWRRFRRMRRRSRSEDRR